MKFPNLNSRLKMALIEDGAYSDVTTRPLASIKTSISARILAKEKGIFCGSFLLKPVFGALDKRMKIRIKVKDGTSVSPGRTIAILKGNPKAILSGERVFLNLATHLSGIATLTKAYVKAAGRPSLKVMDTRKTIPLWRDLEKFAVVCGGGINHRMSLKDAILIKDNHLKLIRSHGLGVTTLYKNSKQKGVRFLEIEAQNNKDVWDGIKLGANTILLDNMSIKKMKDAILFIKAARKALNRPTPYIEVSGGVTKKTIRQLSKLDVDQISVGALTHSAPALDLSLEVN